MWLSNYILNQGGAPAILEGLFVNRPAAGVIGRIYVSTDTFAIYRDNGTGYDEIGGTNIGFVPYTGATQTVNLNTQQLNAGLVNLSSRLNVNGATDNSLYQLNVTGNGVFSGDVAAGNFIGIASTASTITTNDNNTTSAVYYPLWATAAGSNKDIYLSSTRLTFNPSIGLLATSRVNLNGAADNVNFALNVTGSIKLSARIEATYGVFSSGTTYINATTTIPSVSNAKLIVKSSTADFIIGLQANSAAGSSYGPMIQAGTNGSDIAFLLRDAANTNDYFKIRGDGIISTFTRLNVSGATDNSLFALNVSGTINGSLPSYTGNTYTVTGNLTSQFYHVFTGAVGQTLTAPTPSGNNAQYLIVNNSANILTVAAFSGTNIITILGATSATITLAANARTLLIADGNNKYYQAF